VVDRDRTAARRRYLTTQPARARPEDQRGGAGTGRPTSHVLANPPAATEPNQRSEIIAGGSGLSDSRLAASSTRPASRWPSKAGARHPSTSSRPTKKATTAGHSSSPGLSASASPAAVNARYSARRSGVSAAHDRGRHSSSTLAAKGRTHRGSRVPLVTVLQRRRPRARLGWWGAPRRSHAEHASVIQHR